MAIRPTVGRIRLTMWDQYRKTAPYMQVFILIACVTVFFIADRQWPPVLVIFVVMQIGSFLGAAWGVRLRNKRARREDDLPLRK